MATEDERYRQSSQFRLWSFSPAALQELREKTNGLARQQIAPRLQADPLPEFLTADEEVRLVKFYTNELIRAAEFINLPAEIRATAAIFLRRFYVTNSVMTYPPTEILKTSLFFGCKAESFYMRLGKFVDMFPNTTGEQILAGEFLLCQGLRFAFDVRHPFRALEGAVMELKRKLPADDETAKRINRAHVRAREFLKFSTLVTDVYFHFTPSQIMMAALQAADADLLHALFPAPSDDVMPAGAHTDLREKIFETIEACRHMLEEEPPERQSNFWGTPEGVKSIKAPRRKLTKCRDPDRADLVALQKARREQANKPKPATTIQNDGAVFGEVENRDAKRRKLEAANDPFGPALG